MMQILVTHPGRQHSHQLAEALGNQGWLAGYWTGVPVADPSTKGPLYRVIAQASPQPTLDLPASAVKHNYVMPLTRRLVEAFCSPSRVVDLRHRAVAGFDAWAATHLPADVDAVVAYENGCQDTFQAAKRHDVTTILDAASFHYAWQDAFFDPVESASAHRRINERKEEEIQLADHVLTVSELARQSYIDGGVPPDRVTSVPMGADLSDFTPRRTDTTTSSDPFTFLFAGHADRRKGVDLLLDASARLAQDPGISHRVQFAGGRDEALFEGTQAPIERLGYLNRRDLAEAFRQADCLVLPSRHDSFGRVVVEALATGLPVLVSEHVGAREVVEKGSTGWVVSAEDVDALADRMRWCIEHPDEVRAMRDAAIESARDYSWTAYRNRVVEVIEEVVRPSAYLA